MPVLFIGHGSPMNGIEDNEFSGRWKAMAKEISTPAAVLVVSAHWFTREHVLQPWISRKLFMTLVDFHKSFLTRNTKAPGNPTLAKETVELLHSAHVE